MTNYSGSIYLTSTGLSASPVREAFSTLAKMRKYKSVAIVTTAAAEKEKGKHIQLAKKQLQALQFERIDFADLEASQPTDFSVYDVIYVCGGNTYKLLHFARKVAFDQSVKQLLQKDGCYIGVSAGSILLGPLIDIANDPNDIGVKDYAGLHIVDMVVLPHYEPSQEARAVAYEKRTKLKVLRQTNDEALVIEWRHPVR